VLVVLPSANYGLHGEVAAARMLSARLESPPRSAPASRDRRLPKATGPPRASRQLGNEPAGTALPGAPALGGPRMTAPALATFTPASEVHGRYDTLVVGAGFAGAVIAERLASQCGQRVLVIDRRDHIGGNAFDYYDQSGVLCHRYGPHIFHTQSVKVWSYLSAFTRWRPYEHRVLARVREQLVPLPINRHTINLLYGLALTTDGEVAEFLARRAEPRERVLTSEDTVVAKVGRELYELFFRGYTRKQWALDPSQLHASVCARIPIRHNTDDRYFTDRYQAVPADGYTAMFARILEHPRIDVALNVAYDDLRAEVDHDHLVYTGPIDAFFGYRFGQLPYRSLRFEHEVHLTPGGELVQPAASINFPDEAVAWTRQSHGYSTIAIEYPLSDGEPYYPIPRPENRELYKRYEALAERDDAVTFVGRLARYQYLNMDQVVGQALATFERLVLEGRAAQPSAAPGSNGRAQESSAA
jgi:UDP-galactopyranose mutase